MNTATQTINLDAASWAIKKALETAQREFSLASNPYGGGVTVQDAAQRAGAIVRAWRTGLEAVNNDGMANNAVKSAAADVLKAGALAAIDDLERRFNAALTTYRAGLVAPLLPLPVDQAERIWRRLRDQLQAGIDTDELIQDSDTAALQVMLEELKAWNRTQRPTDLRGADYVSAGQVESIHRRLYDLADPAARAKIDQARASDQGEAWTQTAFAMARHTVEALDAQPAGFVVAPDWNGKTFVM